MNSFTLTAVGNLARNPEAVAKGDITYTRFILVGNDYAGKDEEGAPREIVTSLRFVAFGALAESLVRSARKGDQLFVEARVRASSWTDKQGEKQYDYDFVVQGFRFGAPGKIKREERDARREDGAHRGEERTNGRGSHATFSDGDGGGAIGNTNAKASLGHGTNGAGAGNGSNAGNGANTGNGANSGASANTGAANGGGVSGGKGVTAGKGVSADTGANTGAGANSDATVNADSGANGAGANDGGAKGASGNSAAGVAAPTASEKAVGSRAGRRAASPPP